MDRFAERETRISDPALRHEPARKRHLPRERGEGGSMTGLALPSVLFAGFLAAVLYVPAEPQHNSFSVVVTTLKPSRVSNVCSS